MATIKDSKKGEILSIKTDGESPARSSDLVFMVGDTVLGGVISVDIGKIETNSIVEATIKLHVTLG